jgi:hypothetical protein
MAIPDVQYHYRDVEFDLKYILFDRGLDMELAKTHCKSFQKNIP